MKTSLENRERLLGWMLALAAAGFGSWWTLDYAPRLRSLSSGIETLREQQLRNREARLQIVQIGLPGMEEATRRARAELVSLEGRVPTRDEGATAAGEMARAITGIAAGHRVRIHTLRPIPTATEGPFQLHGIEVLAAARYHEIGAFLTGLLSLPRTSRIRGARLDAVPDSLLREAQRSRASPAPAGAAPPAELPPGEAPFTVVARFTFHWFSLPPSAVHGDTAPESGGS